MPEDKKNKIQGMLDSAAGISDSAERSRKYRNIVGILAQEAMRAMDSWYLEEAIKTAGLVTDDPSKAYVDIVRAMAKIGVNRKDEETLSEALKITEKIDNDLDLSVALHELVVAFARYGMDKKDERLFSYSVELMQRIPLNTFRSSAFRNNSRLLAGSNPEKAMELLENAIELIEKSKDTEPVYLASAFCDIAALLANGRSSDFIRKAIALANDLVDDFEKSAVLLKIVETEIVVGTQRHDDKLLKDAVMISKGITREYYKTLALEAIKGLD
jgi:tetratricopeptide (TPR) repeat protein